MGRYTVDDQKGYQFAIVNREPTGDFAEAERDIYEYIEALSTAVETLEKKLASQKDED